MLAMVSAGHSLAIVVLVMDVLSMGCAGRGWAVLELCWESARLAIGWVGHGRGSPWAGLSIG
jgi:hypothetical protein